MHHERHVASDIAHCPSRMVDYPVHPMPELPEVEVLAQHLRDLVVGQTLHRAKIFRPRTCRPDSPQRLARRLAGRRIEKLERRAKYLLFTLESTKDGVGPLQFLAHLGMTGRLFLHDPARPLPPHTTAILEFDRGILIFQDTRYFGRLTLDLSPLQRLGPEPLSTGFTTQVFASALRTSRQPVKVRLLDQAIVAGLGNIYASEALFRARIHPALPAHRLTQSQVSDLRRAIRAILRQAIAWGSTAPLNWSGTDSADRFFYYGRAPDTPNTYEERLRVYDRAGQPCSRCRKPIERLLQAGRSTYVCPACQPL
jgi:formamidopyrimidine-DNA glycosylase